MDLQELQERAGAAERLLKALANRRRLMILCQLHDGERSVTALHADGELSQSALSQHLAKLREQGLVATRREAQTIYYRLASQEVSRVIATLYDIYCAPSAAERPDGGAAAATTEG